MYGRTVRRKRENRCINKRKKKYMYKWFMRNVIQVNERIINLYTEFILVGK
jgi:hypothetical protein